MSDHRRPRFLRADSRREGYSPSPTRLRTSSRTKEENDNKKSTGGVIEAGEETAQNANRMPVQSSDRPRPKALEALLDMTARTRFRAFRSRRFSSPVCDQRAKGSEKMISHGCDDLIVPLMVTSTRAIMSVAEQELHWLDTTTSVPGMVRCPFWKATLDQARAVSTSDTNISPSIELPPVRTRAQEFSYTAFDIHDSEVLDMIDAIRPPLQKGPCPSYQSESSIILTAATLYQQPELQTLSSLKVAARIYQVAYQLHLEEFQNAAIDFAHSILRDYSIPPALLTLPQWDDYYHTKFWKMMY